MLKVLVMGGAGFLGSNLSKALLDNNFKVYCLDNLSTGSTTNIHQLVNHPNFTFIEHDVRNRFSFNCCLKSLLLNINFSLLNKYKNILAQKKSSKMELFTFLVCL